MTTRQTNEQIAELERLDREATKGPWRTHGDRYIERDDNWILAEVGPRGPGFFDEQKATQRLIAAARNALPSLLAEVRAGRSSPSGREAGFREGVAEAIRAFQGLPSGSRPSVAQVIARLRSLSPGLAATTAPDCWACGAPPSDVESTPSPCAEFSASPGLASEPREGARPDWLPVALQGHPSGCNAGSPGGMCCAWCPDDPAPGSAPERGDGDRVQVAVTRRADDDETISFDAPGFTTVRPCVDCGVLMRGGPTRCLPCAAKLPRPSHRGTGTEAP